MKRQNSHRENREKSNKLDRINTGEHGFLFTMKKNNIEDPDPSGINHKGHRGLRGYREKIK